MRRFFWRLLRGSHDQGEVPREDSLQVRPAHQLNGYVSYLVFFRKFRVDCFDVAVPVRKLLVGWRMVSLRQLYFINCICPLRNYKFPNFALGLITFDRVRCIVCGRQFRL